MTIDWEPITAAALQDRIHQGYLRMSPELRRIWEAVRIEPEKWQQHPYGDQGQGFWVVGLIGRTVLWYNDLEEGFNRSRYTSYGRIEEYWCNQDELETTLQYLANALKAGQDLLHIPAKRRSRRP